jgi:putative SOS response-associated peptidase YedK
MGAMCNHYRKGPEVVRRSLEIIRGLVPGDIAPGDFPADTFPKRPAPVVMQERGTRTLVEMRWGVERFIGDGKTKPVTNARNDRLLSRTWKKCAETRRCLVPATGYYEPGRGPAGAKGKILFTVRERPVFFFAGLWDMNADGRAFTLVTTEPNDFVRRFHDRMPVVLDDGQLDAWLGDEPLGEEQLRALCRGLPSEALMHEELPPALKISRPARKPRNHDGPELF